MNGIQASSIDSVTITLKLTENNVTTDHSDHVLNKRLLDIENVQKIAFDLQTGHGLTLNLKAGLEGGTYWVTFTQGEKVDKGKFNIPKTIHLTPSRVALDYGVGTTVVASNFDHQVTDTFPAAGQRQRPARH